MIQTLDNTLAWQPNTLTSRYVGLLRRIGTETPLCTSFCVKAVSRKTSSEDTWLENLKMRHLATLRQVSFRPTMRTRRVNHLRMPVAAVLKIYPALLREEVQIEVHIHRFRPVDRTARCHVLQVHAIHSASPTRPRTLPAVEDNISHPPRTFAARKLNLSPPGRRARAAREAPLA